MVNDNVVQLPDALERRAQRIEAAIIRRTKGRGEANKGRSEWIEGTLQLAEELVAARDDYPNDATFGKWFDERFTNASVPPNDRWMLIQWGRDIAQARNLMENSESWSVQILHRSFTNTGKTRHVTSRPRVNKVEAVAQVIKEETGQWPSTKKLAEVAGIGPRNADNALRTVKAVEAAVKTLPELKYTKAQENHVEARAKVLELTFEQRVQEQVNALFEQALAQRDKYDAELIEQALAVMEFDRKHRSRPFTAGEYTGVLMRALHPDTTTPENRMEAFKLVNNRKLLLRDEGRIKLRGSLAAQLPKTPAEWAAAKRTAAEARKHK